MAFHDLELQRIRNSVGELCHRRSPVEHKDELRVSYGIERHTVTIYIHRPGWGNPDEWTQENVARLKYNRTQGEWSLYWMRQDLKWHRYDPAPVTGDLGPLVEIIDEDEFGAFWG